MPFKPLTSLEKERTAQYRDEMVFKSYFLRTSKFLSGMPPSVSKRLRTRSGRLLGSEVEAVVFRNRPHACLFHGRLTKKWMSSEIPLIEIFRSNSQKSDKP
ncbi:hypothetical protein [Sphingobacterium sp.]|uniref:hypothetical protein n=1 Tax=Sphingobacterium sp. TaxID=341027 RepID=UPI00289B8696|nr:hypothetical protein [Sphingobacterium sp.]